MTSAKGVVGNAAFIMKLPWLHSFKLHQNYLISTWGSIISHESPQFKRLKINESNNNASV